MQHATHLDPAGWTAGGSAVHDIAKYGVYIRIFYERPVDAERSVLVDFYPIRVAEYTVHGGFLIPELGRPLLLPVLRDQLAEDLHLFCSTEHLAVRRLLLVGALLKFFDREQLLVLAALGGGVSNRGLIGMGLRLRVLLLLLLCCCCGCGAGGSDRCTSCNL